MPQASDETRRAVARALAYPYHRPPGSFLFSAGRAKPFTPENAALLSPAQRDALVPVLAVGSNAAPEQLARKFGQAAEVQIPVTLGFLTGVDIAYCAYMTGYGSVPATLIESAGVRVAVGITWLNAQQLATMHLTEAVGSHTDYGCLSLDSVELSPSLKLAGGNLSAGLFTYRSRLGLLGIDQQAVSLAELPATGRRSLALTQQQLQRRIRRWAECKMLSDRQSSRADHLSEVTSDFPEWVCRNVNDAGRRLRVNEVLQACRIDHEIAGFKIASVT